MSCGTSHHPDLKLLLCLRSAKKHREAIRWKAQGPREALPHGQRISCLALPKTARMGHKNGLEGLPRKESHPPGGSSGCNGSSTSSSICSSTFRSSLVH